MGLFGGGKTEMKSGPWSRMENEMRDMWGDTRRFYRSGEWENALRYGPYSAVPGMNPLMSQGFAGVNRLGTGPRVRRSLREGLNTMRDTARGDYLYGGEGFNAAVDASLRHTMPAISSQFGGAGRTGSAYHANTLGQAASDAFASQYGQERGRQMGAAGAIPGMAQAQFMPYQQMMNAGRQQYQMYDAPMARENVMRNQMNRRAGLGALQGLFGNTLQTAGLGSSGYQQQPGAGFMPPLLGTGLTLAGIGGPGGFGWWGGQ